MPAFEYMNVPPRRHDDEELQSLLDEMYEKTGYKWYAETLFRGRHKVGTTSLYKSLGYGEYQVLYCVRTIREAKAYLLGALDSIDKYKDEENGKEFSNTVD